MVLIFGVLGTRLAYLQIDRGQVYAARAEANRTTEAAIPAPRGLIFDRKGRVLVNNVASWTVKIVPADLPFSQREDVAQRLGTLLKMEPSEILTTLDSAPGSRFDPVRVAQDVPEKIARIVSESVDELPGVDVSVDTLREYPDGPLLSQVVGYTGAIDGGTLDRLKTKGYLSDDIDRQGGRRGIVRVGAPRHLRQGAGGARRHRPRRPGPPDAPAGRSRRLAHADDRQDDPEGGDRRPQVGDAGRRAQARRVHRDEPADGRGARPREPADLRQQPVLGRHLVEGLPAPRRQQERAAHEPGGPGQLPARIDVQAGHGDGRRWPTRRSPRPRSSGRAGT